MSEDGERLAKLEAQIEDLQRRVGDFITSDRFAPVERLCYTVAALVISSVVAGLVALLIKH